MEDGREKNNANVPENLGEEHLRLFVEHTPAAIAMFDMQMRYLLTSKRWLSDYNLGERNIVGLSHYEVFPEIGERWKAIHRRCLAGAVERCEEDEFVRASGRIDWVKWEVRPWYTVSGKIGGIVMFTEVVTERKRAAEALHQANESLERERNILQTVMNGARNSHLVYLDREFNFVRVNETYAKTCGYAPEQMIGKNHFALYPHEENEAIFARVRDTGIPAEYHDKPFVFPDQPERGVTYWDWTLMPIPSPSGKVEGLVFSLVETTERKRLEESLQEADRKKDEYLAVLAHELRNPMAAISSAATVLTMSSKIPEEKREFAKNALRQRISQLTRLIDDLLDVSKIVRGKIELQKEELDLASVVHAAAESTKRLFDERQQSVRVLVLDRLPVYGDAVRLEQVISNLLSNSSRYSGTGDEITLLARREGREAVIKAIDKGVGIDPVLLPKLFDLFAQGGGAHSPSRGGLGVGLTIVKKLTEMHGGAVMAYSEGPGKGSEFTVRLPLSQVQHAARQEKAPPPVERGLHILLVEDNADTALMMAEILRMNGQRVEIASDGYAALAAAAKDVPDAILLDLGLPSLSGYDVAKKLRESGLTETLIIAVTGYGQERDLERSREAGIDYHLLKPVDYARLAPLLAQVRRRLPRSESSDAALP